MCHLLNDFHDILTGSCSQAAEKDALDLYGKVLETTRRLRLGAASALNRALPGRKNVALPVTILNSNPASIELPVEVECMADYRPFWKGEWHLRVFGRDGCEVPSQEEQPESLLPFNWRKKICFRAGLPDVGVSHYEVKAFRGKRSVKDGQPKNPELIYKIDTNRGLITSLSIRNKTQLLTGPLLEPLVVKDEGDSWGTGCWAYRNVVSRFRFEPGSLKVIEKGPVRTITESVLTYKKSRIVFHVFGCPGWSVLEFRLRVHWNEERAMLKLAVPTAFRSGRLFCEVPGGAIYRPADGQEHVFGRWALVEAETGLGRMALAVVGCGQHGLDFLDSELRISILRSAAYCHERGFKLADTPARKFMDQGVHEMRFLVMAGDAESVHRSVASLADWLSRPPYALAHFPIGEMRVGTDSDRETEEWSSAKQAGPEEFPDERESSLLSLSPENIRLTACKPSWDRKALVIRLHETSGLATSAELTVWQPLRVIGLRFKPFEIKTVRLEPSGAWREVGLISEA